MVKRLLVCTVAILLVVGVALAGEKDKEAEGTWVGWVTDTLCAAKGQKAAHADCAHRCVRGKGAKWALYNDADGKLYVLQPQEKAADHAGHHVKVKGTVEGETIQVASIQMTGEQKGIEKQKEKDKAKTKTKSTY